MNRLLSAFLLLALLPGISAAKYYKNKASKIYFHAWNTSADAPKTGDAANLTAYVSIDGAAESALTDTSATEVDATNCPGSYVFDTSNGEMNGSVLLFTCKSSTANVYLTPVTVAPDEMTSAAMANMLAFFDGTGYAGGTIKLEVDRVKVGGTANASATIANAFGGSTFQSVDDVFDEALSGHSTAGTAGKALTDIGTKTGYLPSATAGSAGGVFIAGSNAATSITTALTANITGNLSGSVGSVTNGVSLADDAITASKFDESTAFPLKSADTGSTAIARTGADSDTLKTLSDQLDGVVSGALTEEEMIASMRENLMEAAIDADPNTDSLFDIGARLGVLEAKLASMIESDGSTGWEYTAASLINSPTGSGGFTEADRTNLGNILTDTAAIQNTLGAAGAGLTGIPWNAAWDAEVQSEATDALNAYDPPTNAEMEARTITAASYFNPATDKVYLGNGAHGGAEATVTAKQIALTNSDAGGIALDITGSGTGNSHAIRLTSTNGKALAAGSTNSDAVSINSTNASGMVVVGATGDIVSDITGQVSGTASLLPTNFSTVTVADGKIASDGTVSLTEDDVTDIATAIANALNASGVTLTEAEKLAIVKAIEKILP